MSAERDLEEAVTLLHNWLHASSNRLDRIAMNRARDFLARPNIRKLIDHVTGGGQA